MDSANRRGGWVKTFTGRAFWPLDPRPDEVHIADIAHSLSQQSRWGGHGRRFYSVAEHSVLLARAVAKEHRLAALMHDAAEAYLVDLPRPVKRSMPDYTVAETAVWLAICARFGISPEVPAAVCSADDRLLTDEDDQNMAPLQSSVSPSYRSVPLGVELRFWSPVEAEMQFMAEFDFLTGGRFGSTAPFDGGARALTAAAREARHG